MPTPTSQGAIVSFDGTTLGRVTSIRVAPGTAQFEDVTNVGSEVVGTGLEARVIREITCTAIEPGGVDVTLYGCPPYGGPDVGDRAVVTVAFGDESFTGYAYLESFEVTGNVGQFLTGSARFRFNGRQP